jgi:hypothetical protein
VKARVRARVRARVDVKAKGRVRAGSSRLGLEVGGGDHLLQHGIQRRLGLGLGLG